ncbi:MAG: dihydroorotase [Candidatus Heimdallarchaeota archaeon]
MTIDLNIVNGNLFLGSEFRQGGISIEGERIVKIGKEPSLPKASHKIDANGAIVIPGIIDIHVHFRDLQQKYKETLVTGMRSALAGGVTTVLDMPNNKPPTDSVRRIQDKETLIHNKAAVNIGFYSLFPKNNLEIIKLANKGAFEFKIYPADTNYPPKDNDSLNKAMMEIAKTKLPVIIHPDNGFAGETEKQLFATDSHPIDAFIKAHNQLEEAQALETFIDLSNKVDGKLHCAHVTAKETVEIITKNKDLQLLSSEVCPHHLTLSVKELRKFNSQAKCLPPLRTKQDQDALWHALNNDLINIIATDHAPHSYEEKHCEFEVAASGIHGLETLAPIMFTHALKGMISFEKLIPKMTMNPAKLMGIEHRGELLEGNFADVVILKKKKYKIASEEFESKAKWSPFNGYEVSFLPEIVLVNGFLAKEEEYINSKATTGKIIRNTNEKLEIE